MDDDGVESMKKKTNRTYIGGQAVIQGVMMRSKHGMATVVRDDNGRLQTEIVRIKAPEERPRWQRVPFLRGIVSFASSLVGGMKVLMRSSEVVFPDEEEQKKSKLSKWMAEKWKVSAGDIVTSVSLVLGIVLAVGLFVYLPLLFTRLIAGAAPAVGKDRMYGLWYYLIEGGFRLAIFVLYVLFTLLFRSLRETYMYHGAEHKTINCFEYGLPLTVENVKKCSRLHDRCGTTFLFLVLIISIVVFALAGVPLDMLFRYAGIAGFAETLLSILFRILLLPLVAGVSYEILKLLSYTDSPLVLPLKAPGYLLQKLTTREPDDGMIECAILAFEHAKEMDDNPECKEKFFATETKLSKLMEKMKRCFAANGIDESDAEWILSISLGIRRSALSEERVVTRAECKKVLDVFEQRLTGRPLWYVYGDAEFYGYTFKVDERALIPRPETEILVQQAVAALKEGDRMLDLCTGSGAIAVAAFCEASKDRNVSVTASDISEQALELARENARLNKANIQFVKSDLFENIRGRFELITVNPPYVKSGEIASLPKDVRDFEPHIALDGGKDGLDFYRAIAEKAGRYIARGGMIILECGEGQAQDIIKIFRQTAHCDFAMVVKDLAGADRVVKLGF